MENLKNLIKNLQIALLKKKYIVRINTYQFYSKEQHRFVTGYSLVHKDSTELLARQICMNEGISFTYFNRMDIDALLTINKIAKLAESDLFFAQKLYNKDVTLRYTWLTNKVNQYIKRDCEQEKLLLDCLSKLRGI